MAKLPVTSALAGYSAIFTALIGFRVAMMRVKNNTLYGNGKPEIADDVQKKVRSHGNAVEWIPLYVILTGLMEAEKYVGQQQLIGLATAFAAARTAHSVQLAGDKVPLWVRPVGMITQLVLYVYTGGVLLSKGIKALSK